MNISSIKITIKKELRSIIRDKKTLITILVFPILIPAMIFLYSYIYDSQTKDTNYNIAIDYQIDTTVKSILSSCHLTPTYYQTVNQMQNAYKQNKIDAYIHYDQTQNKYTIYANSTSEDGMYASNYATNYLKEYNDYLTKIYLISEDIDVEDAYNNFTYELQSLEGENFILQIIFSIAFTYIIMSIVLACTNMATSATAVEKENGTLETLLTFPINITELIIGKYLASFLLGLISSLIGLILTTLTIIITPQIFDIFSNFPISITPLTIIISILICILSSLFIAGISIAITANSKTYKEAQSSSQILSILTIIPMMASIIGIDTTTIYYLIPIANYVQLLMDIFSKNYNFLNITLVTLSTIIYVTIVIYCIIKEYKSEKILFSN